MGSNFNREIDLLPENMEFAIFSNEEIKKLSVRKIITGQTFDPLGHPLSGGLYDNIMGPSGRSKEHCLTCLNISACPGHMGHIELNARVYNPFFIKVVQKILTLSCLHCYKLQIKPNVLEILHLQLRLIDAGFIVEAKELEIFKSEVVSANVDAKDQNKDNPLIHPRIAEMHKLLEIAPRKVDNNKSICAVRSSITNAALERPSSKKCMHCSNSMRTIKYLHKKLVYFISKAELKSNDPDAQVSAGKNKDILADECNKYLREIYENHKNVLKLLFPILCIEPSVLTEKFSPVDLFFMDVVPVTPPNARPSNVLRDQIIEHPQTSMYRNIIENNNLVRVVIKFLKEQTDDLPEEAQVAYDAANGKTPLEKFYNAWHELQESVNVLLDAAMNRDPLISQGLKQVLEKKEGLIRKHMMGKRVNFAARTVITPDPNINVEEVGIPVIFAKKLSYPVPVTAHNVSELRKMVINGPNNHPGANYIQDEKGYTTFIPPDDDAKRESMAKLLLSNPENGMKIVHRHVLNGDILLLNRQPSLHKPSIMAHKARILPGEKTFRMHYSNCKAYNADFDGDEMNAHLPQSEVARSEAYNLVNVANNYLVPKDGTPLGGLIQDHVISGVKLSMRGRFFNREDYQQLVFQGLANVKGNVKLLPPTIIKPIALWSGKQILSTIIMNLIPKDMEKINLNSKAKMNSKVWQRDRNVLGEFLDDLSESQVIIRNGELLVGVLDKQQYGATTFGLVHCMYELYGGDVSTALLTAFTKVFTFFLQREGFTLGVKDILVAAEGDKKRQKIIKESRQIGNAVVAEALGLSETPTVDVLAEKMEEAYVKDPNFRLHLDRTYKSYLDNYTNEINKQCIPFGLIEKFPYNNLQLMVQSGAKGSLVNTMQISSLLGQIELEGKRPPLMISGKSLPCFTSFETSPKSGGFIDGRFMTGIQPQDFFFHCMAGREGLIDTAVKTSRSGYLQRCLIKHLEGLNVAYDLTVRDSDNSVVQYLYGEDGLDILKSKFFDRKEAYEFLYNNIKAILRPEELASIKDEAVLNKVIRHSKAIKSWLKKNKAIKSHNERRLSSPFAKFSFEQKQEIEVKNPNKVNKKTGRTKLTEALIKNWYNEYEKENDSSAVSRCPDPVIAQFKQDNCYGSISERLADIINKKWDEKTRDEFANLVYLKNLKAVAAPGEPVGLIAAQSIGEPSTQMTLNTFHFAGRGEMNVTLGIPRLREILMLASSNIKTPAMEIPIRENQLKNAKKLRISLNRVTLADILQHVKVNVKTIIEPERVHQYKLHFEFLPRAAYKNDFCVKPKNVIKYMTNTFMKQLFRSIIKSSQKKGSVVEIEEKKKGKAKEKDDDDEGYEDDEAADNLNMNAMDASQNNNQSDDDGDSSDEDQEAATKEKTVDYDEPEDNDEGQEVEENDDDDDENETSVQQSGQKPSETNDQEKDEEAVEDEESKEDKILSSALSNNLVRDFIYDKENYLWCKLSFNLEMRYEKPNISSLIRELAQKSIIHQVPNINRAIIGNSEHGKQTIKTDGINIVKMFTYENILDLNALYSNDIHAIAKTYGIEAAQRVIIKEISNVFKVYGITVDYRHLSLIADYMTFDGTFQPLSRKGMEHSASPLQQMSFESCLQFLKNAASAGKSDAFESPSSRLMVGLPVRNGTGCFDLLTTMNRA